MTEAVGGFGTRLIWNNHRILELLSISGPSQSRDTIDATSHDSADEFREYIAGVASGGEISLEGNLIIEDELGQENLLTDMLNGTKRTAWIIPPMDVGISFEVQATVTAFSPSAPHDGKMDVSATLQVSEKPALTTVQSAGMSALTGIEETGSAALSVTPAIDPGTYEYACTVDPASTWVQLTVTAVGHTIYVQGTAQDSGVQGGQIALNDAGEDTEIFIMVYETDEAPRLYVLTVTRPSA